MIPSRKTRAVTSGGVMTQGVFGISDQDQAHILQILRDRLYTNKILAVLREYGSNAWDEHRDAGTPDRPIKVVLPTRLVPALVIRDYGRGLSEDDVLNVYVKYGASTKRDADVAVGMLGIGAKSAFAYADSFTVTSFQAGVKSIYVAVLDESDVGVINKLGEAPCKADETGVEIKVQVDPKDIWDFQREAAALFPFFNPQPVINLELPKLELDKNSAGFVYAEQFDGLDQWVAVMGCVPYRIDFTSVSDRLQDAGLLGFSRAARGGLLFDIGDVDVAANREGLEYTEDTKNGIVERLGDLRDEIIKDLAKSVDDPTLSHWERRRKVLRLMTARGLSGLQEAAKGYESSSVTIIPADPKEAPKEFRLRHLQKPGYKKRAWTLESIRRIEVDVGTRFIIRDNAKNSRGYYKSNSDRFILPINGVDDAEKELLEVLEKHKLTGVPVLRASKMTYVPFSTSSRNYGPSNSKYNQRTFVLSRDEYFSYDSKDWSKAEIPLDKDDVFVILKKFKSCTARFYNRVDIAQDLAKLFKEPLPDFYGLRSTQTKPVYADDVDAIPFTEWYESYLDDLLRLPRAKYLARAYAWTISVGSTADTTEVEKLLGKKHRISKFLRTDREYRKALYAAQNVNAGALWERSKQAHPKSAPGEAGRDLVRDIKQRYPLLQVNNPAFNMNQLTSRHAADWIEYIQLVDSQRKK